MRILKVNSNKFETLSALIDGEVDNVAEVLKQVSVDPELKAQWAAHYRTKAALHGEFSASVDSGFAGRVSAALNDEPAILAPRAAEAKPAATASRWQRPLAGLAIAATVAAVSVIEYDLLSCLYFIYLFIPTRSTLLVSVEEKEAWN